jgi:flagellar hook-length control protein FliK
MKANLKANSKEATALLSQNLAEIKKQLTEQNIKIADVNIELYQDDTTFFSEQGFGRQLSEEQGRSSSSKSNTISNVTTSEEEFDDSNIAAINNNIEFFA